jgi:hypothetical protein
MRSDEYPEMYRTSDERAVKSQRAHFRTVQLEIFLLLTTAALGSLPWGSLPTWRDYATFAMGLVLFLVIVVGLARFAWKFDHAWFASRAVAESVKIETWRFMTKAAPYSGQDKEARDQFRAQLQKLLESAPPEAKSLVSAATAGAPQVTETMLRVRGLPIPQRKDFYQTNRLSDQRSWYATKADSNSRKEKFWFLTSLILQIAAAGVALSFIIAPSTLAPVGILTTAAAAGRSWSNAKSHRELSQSYGMISKELAVLADYSSTVGTEEDLARLVENTERTISREHSIWVFRRGLTPGMLR